MMQLLGSRILIVMSYGAVTSLLAAQSDVILFSH